VRRLCLLATACSGGAGLGRLLAISVLFVRSLGQATAGSQPGADVIVDHGFCVASLSLALLGLIFWFSRSETSTVRRIAAFSA